MPQVATVILTLLLLLASSPALGANLNLGRIDSQANQDADITLTQIPRNMTPPNERVTIQWEQQVFGRLRFATGFSGDTPAGYRDSLASQPDTVLGSVRFRGNELPVGYLYCIIDAGQAGYSMVFNIIIVADHAPRMVAPITAAGRAGINTVTPAFRWEPVSGVPFYHIIVSDQPFEIHQDQDGRTKVEGANIVWQAITSETSIQYGIADPSEYFDNDQAPPLVGTMDRNHRPRYNWVVLNNFGNHPAYSSTISGGVSGFEVEIQPPFDAPQNVAPQTRAQVSGREVLFRWTEIEDAVSYFVYVSKEEITQGGSQAFVPAWNAQTTFTSIACPASDVLSQGRYVWKVLAASRQGRGMISDTTSFTYVVQSGQIRFTTSNLEGGGPVEFTQITTEPIAGSAIPTFSSNDQGEVTRNIPIGLYRFIASKEGFSDVVRDSFRIEADQSYSISFRLSHIPSSLVGTAVDQDNRPIGRVTVTATLAQDGSVTSSETNVSGEYQMIVQPGDYLINATAAGRAPPEEFAVSAREGQVTDIDAVNGRLVLPAYRFNVAGYVRNTNGQPVSSATVILTGPDGTELRAYTPEAGNYTFGVGPGTWRINAVKPGFYLESGEVELQVRDQDEEVNFTLIPQAGVLSGQVMLDGAPANRNAEVLFIPSAGEVVSAPVNQVGAFSRGVAPGDYVVVGIKAGYSTEDSLEMSVEGGETISGLRLGLTANPSSIAGRVVDNAGNPIREAEIRAGGTVVRTDANGSYRLGAPAGEHMVSASRPSFVTAQRGPVSIAAGQNLQGIDFRLADNAGTISGRVRRGNDPIVDALVTAARQGEGGGQATVRTDRQGNYSFSLSYGSYRISVQREGMIAAAPGYIDIQLQAGQQVTDRNFAMQNYSGRIVGSVSSPAGGVNTPTIRITALNDQNNSYSTSGNVQGAFALSVTPERRYIVVVSKVGYSTAQDTTSTVAIEGEAQVTLRLTPLPCLLSGAVTAQGGDVTGATIRAEGQGGVFEATADRSARYQLAVRPGNYRLTASKPGYTIAQRDIGIAAGEDRGGIDFALQPNFALISGLVRNPDNEAIAGVDLLLIDSTANRVRTATTDRDGGYEIGSIIPGNYYLIATSETHRRIASNLGELAGRQVRRGVNVRMTPFAATLQGRVTASGSPVGGSTVYAREAGGEQFSTTTSQDGRYTLRNVSDGTFSIRAAKAGYSSVERAGIQVRPADTLDVDLELILNNGRITGVVRDPDGAALRDVRVTAQDNLGNFAAVTSNASGQFALENLYPRSQYFVVPVLANNTPDRDTIRNVNPGDALTIRMTPNQLRLTGQVVNQVGNAIRATDLIITSQADGSTFRATANDAGSFSVVGLAPRTRYRVQTQRFEDYYANTDTTIEMGANHFDIGPRIRIIQRTASIAGTVGVSGVTMEARNLVNGRVVQGFSDVNGAYQLFKLRGGDFGRFVVHARKDGYSVRPPDSVVVSGVALEERRDGVNFFLDQFVVHITGQVQDSTGGAMDSCTVTAWSETGSFTTETDSTGAFRLAGVYPRQTYAIRTDLDRNGYENAIVQVQVDTLNIANLSLRVGRHNATIKGHVGNASGQDLSNAFVTLDGIRQINGDYRGRFTFPFTYGGVHTLRFERQGYFGFDTTITTGNGEGTDSLGVLLQPMQLTIYGAVLNRSTNVRLPNAVLRLASSAGDTLWDTTSVDGNYSFQNLNPDLTYQLTANKKGFNERRDGNLSVANGSFESIAAMYPLGKGVTGRVIDSVGVGQSKAIVTLQLENGQFQSDTADVSGDYYVMGAPGSALVMATLQPPSQGTSYNIPLFLPPDSLRTQNLQILPAGVLLGWLQTTDGGAPLTIGTVRAENSATGEGIYTVAGNDGSFRLAGLRPGSYSVTVRQSGYALESGVWSFDIAGGQTLQDTLIMTQTGSIIGYVRDPAGNGVARAKVSIHGNSSTELVTNAQGYWALNSPQAGRYSVSISRLGYTTLPDTIFDLAAGVIIQLNLTMEPAPNTISGRATDLSGYPVAGGWAVLRSSVSLDSVQAGESGEYQFDMSGRAVERYTVELHIADYNRTPTRYYITYDVGVYALDCDFVLAAVRGFGLVKGRVTHAGVRVARTPVSVVDAYTGERRGVTTDTSGYFRIPRVVTPGNYRLVTSFGDYPEYRSAPFTLSTDDSIDIQIEFPTGQIAFRMFDSELRPVLGRRVFVSGLDISYNLQLFSDADGRAATPNWLPPGRYSVVPQALTGMLPPASQEIALGSGEVQTITYNLGWKFTPPPPFDYQDSGRVRLEIPVAVTVVDANIFWRSPGMQVFQSAPLHRVVNGAPGRTVRSLTASAGIPALGADAGVVYEGVIPPQRSSGTLTYYVQVGTSEGLTYGGLETAQDVNITARGVLDRVTLSRSQAALPPRIGVPIEIQIKGYDDGNTDLSDDLSQHGVFQWTQIGESIGTLDVSTADSSIAHYIADDIGPVSIRASVTQPNTGVTISQTIEWRNVQTQVSQLDITAPAFFVVSGDSLKFTVTAIDTSGGLVPILPVWSATPPTLATLQGVPYSLEAWLRTTPNVIGRSQVLIKDSLSDIQDSFNADSPDRSQWGIAIYGEVYPGGDDTITFTDGTGFKIEIPPSAIGGNASARVFLAEPELSPVLRLTAKYELPPIGYRTQVEGSLSQTGGYRLTLPLQEGYPTPLPTVGVWNPAHVDWDVVTGEFNTDSSAISITTDQLDGAFALISESQSLGVREIKYSPNPFSPHAAFDPGLSIEFRLTSNLADYLVVSVKIYNMAGQLVRKLIDAKQLPKGQYGRGREHQVIWDGLTDDGLEARNGRYMVVVIAKDASGEAKQVGSAVLIK